MAALCAFMITASAMLGQTEANESPLPDNIVKEMEYYVGNWAVEGDVVGMSLKGRWNAKWAPTKHCLLITYPLKVDGKPITGNGLMGWDTEKKEIVVQMFYSDGTLEYLRYTLESPSVLKGTFVGSTDGKPFKAECEVHKKQPNEWTFQTKGHTIGGKKEGELSVRFIRFKSKQKGEKK